MIAAPTWGHIESGGRYKMAYHSVARVDAPFAVYATVTPNAELWSHTQNGSAYPEQTWLRIDAHNDGLAPLQAECTLLLLKDDGTPDGPLVVLTPVAIGAGGQAKVANLSNACSDAGCLGVIDCNATRPGRSGSILGLDHTGIDSDAASRAVVFTARHELYPEHMQRLSVPSRYTISDVSSIHEEEDADVHKGPAERSNAPRRNGCAMTLTSDTLSLMTYVASVLAGGGNFRNNGFLLRPGVAQRLEFSAATFGENGKDITAVDCSELVKSLLVYSANNPVAAKPNVV